MNVKLYLVDDHKVFREGLCSLIFKELDMKVVGEAKEGRTALKEIQNIKPHLVLMDIGMSDLNGIDATRQIRKNHPKVKVLILSMYSDRHFVVGALQAGASGYLLKENAFEELVRAIRAIMDEQIYLSPELLSMVAADFYDRSQTKPSTIKTFLSAREREVLQLFAEGSSTKEIAAKIGVSVKTVETHRKQIMDKLHLKSIATLTKFAVREGLTSL